MKKIIFCILLFSSFSFAEDYLIGYIFVDKTKTLNNINSIINVNSGTIIYLEQFDIIEMKEKFNAINLEKKYSGKILGYKVINNNLYYNVHVKDK